MTLPPATWGQLGVFAAGPKGPSLLTPHRRPGRGVSSSASSPARRAACPHHYNFIPFPTSPFPPPSFLVSATKSEATLAGFAGARAIEPVGVQTSITTRTGSKVVSCIPRNAHGILSPSRWAHRPVEPRPDTAVPPCCPPPPGAPGPRFAGLNRAHVVEPPALVPVRDGRGAALISAMPWGGPSSKPPGTKTAG